MSYWNPRRKGQSPTCSYCHQLGHDIRHCEEKARDEVNAKKAAGLQKARQVLADQRAAAKSAEEARRTAEDARRAEILERKRKIMADAREVLRLKREAAKPRCAFCKQKGHTIENCVAARINEMLDRGSEASLASMVGHGLRKVTCTYCGSYYHPPAECLLSVLQDNIEIGKRVAAMRRAFEQTIREAEIAAHEEEATRKEAQKAADEAELMRMLAEEQAKTKSLEEEKKAIEARELAELEALYAAEEAEKRLIETMEAHMQAARAEHRALMTMILKEIYGEGKSAKEVAKLLKMSPEQFIELLTEAQQVYGETFGIGLIPPRLEDWDDL